ncbi:NADP-dependent oxidoreductase domain-containing protein [Lipomyces tetrasporus]|uniref:NADP-dependent oxidoreductase domain-containing protein n=1 Tax=Lipomyces tetrasporus TaxID=54092 RepID=A0AAD7QP28_9ASCO|nr:NADP-dependent oxidoreductase domain-containing protein [Lipomyces tetrasporus]KAJ8098688.1 NADP-dependent oxidoreductase domain-containing protein [Lipomyces tetrasporus]
MSFPPAPKPKSLLGYYRQLSPSASIMVSPLCIGAMNFGTAWKDFMGICDKDAVFEILDYYHEHGGNFIDTASVYQDGQSEQWLGEWMESRNVRDQMVVATKYTSGLHLNFPEGDIQVNFAGNSKKALHTSLETSLKRLRTDHVDILYVHYWDYTTSIPELMRSLDDVVRAGKVLYLGISDTPAWIVSKANEYARQQGLSQFVVYQGKWNALERDFEREIIPMTQAEGMGLAPWSAMGGGKFKTAEQWKQNEGRKFGPASENEIKMSGILEKIGEKKDVPLTSIALAYVLHKAPYTFPIIGGRKIEHLKSNIDALGVELSQEDIDEIEAAFPFDLGFPHSFLSRTPNKHAGPGTGFARKVSAWIDPVEPPKPISASKHK